MGIALGRRQGDKNEIDNAPDYADEVGDFRDPYASYRASSPQLALTRTKRKSPPSTGGLLPFCWFNRERGVRLS